MESKVIISIAYDLSLQFTKYRFGIDKKNGWSSQGYLNHTILLNSYSRVLETPPSVVTSHLIQTVEGSYVSLHLPTARAGRDSLVLICSYNIIVFVLKTCLLFLTLVSVIERHFLDLWTFFFYLYLWGKGVS